MSPTEQRIAIAEAIGWDCDPLEARDWTSRGQWCISPNDQQRSLVSKNMMLPNYLNDLNAMHEAEKVLGPKDYERFRWILWGICKRPLVTERHRAQISATASQRAEAFLRTLNLWKN